MLKLLGQWDIPFVRRVAITMRLYGIAFEPLNWSVFHDMEKVRAVNRLITAPSLVLESGEVLIDSAAIIDYLDEVYGRERALLPQEGEQRRKVLQVVALALVACEKIGHLYREIENREPHMRLRVQIERLRMQVQECFAQLEQQLKGDWYVGGNMSHADIAVAVLIGFAGHFGELLGCLPPPTLRKLHKLAARCEATLAFQQTPIDVD